MVNRDWGEYTLSPSSSVSLSMQNLDRSIDDKQSTLDILKAFDMDPFGMKVTETFMVRDFGISKTTSRSKTIDDWQAFNLNIFTLNNLLTALGDTYAKAVNQIILDALTDVNTAVSGTSNVSGFLCSKFN